MEERESEKKKLEFEIHALTTQLGLKQADLNQQRSYLQQMQENMLQGVDFGVAEELRRLQTKLTEMEDGVCHLSVFFFVPCNVYTQM